MQERQEPARVLDHESVQNVAVVGDAPRRNRTIAGLPFYLQARVVNHSRTEKADVTLSVPVLLFTLASTMFAGILFGCAPAWRASGVNLNEALKEGGRSASSRGHNRLRRALVIAEFGLALSLLAGAGLAIRSFWNLARVDLGVRTDHILSFNLPVPSTRFSDSQQIVTFYRQLLEKVRFFVCAFSGTEPS